MSTEMTDIVEFCLEHAGLVPMARQVSLYRSLAEFCANQSDAALFRRMADEIEAAAHARGQLSFRWKAGQSSGDGGRDGQ
jgi:hypothetical protein